MSKMKIWYAVLFVAVIAWVGCGKSEEAQQAPNAPRQVSEASFTTTASGLKYHDFKAGSGAEAQRGNQVTVHYTGWLQSGAKFDSSVDQQQPCSFQLGAGRVIAGWDEGVAGMRVGGQRQLVIPPELGYGPGGYPPVIPANSTLVFEVELLEVR